MSRFFMSIYITDGCFRSDGEDQRPVQYMSQKLFPWKMRYSTIEKDVLGIKWALDYLRYYLTGESLSLKLIIGLYKAGYCLHFLEGIEAVNLQYICVGPGLISILYRSDYSLGN